MNQTPNFLIGSLKYFQRNLTPIDSKYMRKQQFLREILKVASTYMVEHLGNLKV